MQLPKAEVVDANEWVPQAVEDGKLFTFVGIVRTGLGEDDWVASVIYIDRERTVIKVEDLEVSAGQFTALANARVRFDRDVRSRD